ncbi:hypothetical protein SDRG_15837 [Saprolegnia diclina VS20]|uniref:Uncharacterized protein n=1 Tax=Saprolegnia diclina (strain VS20) TaxID=1156394 RepID=T0PZ30_SAPDV|nr:hypothetical protein SDRG_15837 [Saprolegnia diclina VS20]EQC26350.1 hypothetical protein SDRG_15837 [Saprolegnia diclina VS20]|eukprot:XP_008620243.1 hypothetical protein SDRG_15837 [Saprolegnia diclina VS20]
MATTTLLKLTTKGHHGLYTLEAKKPRSPSAKAAANLGDKDDALRITAVVGRCVSSRQKARLVLRPKPLIMAPPHDDHCVTRPQSPILVPSTMSLSPLPPKQRRPSTADDDLQCQDNSPEDCPELTVTPNEAYNRLLKQFEACTAALADAQTQLTAKDETITALQTSQAASEAAVTRLEAETQQLHAKYQCEAKLRMQILLEHSKLQLRWQEAQAKAIELDAVKTELAAQEKRFQEKLEHEKRVGRIELKAAHSKINSLHQTILEMEYESVRKEQTKHDGPSQSAQSRHIQQELMGLQRQRCVSQSKWLFEGDHEHDHAESPRRAKAEAKPKKRDEVNYLFDIAEQLLIFSKDSHLNALTTLEGFEEALEKKKATGSDATTTLSSHAAAFDLAACEAIADEAEALLAQYLFQLP